MHGRPRRAPTAAESAASTAKSSKLRDLQTQLIHNHQNKLYTKETVLTSAKLLEINAEVYTAWNYRKLALQHNLEGVGDAEIVKFLVDDELRTKTEGFDTKENILTEEYELVRQALFTDPSDQSGWFYHLWLLDQTVTLDYPLLISSWPSQGSDWVLSTDANCFKSSPSFGSNCHYSLDMGTLPIILYFNQAVSGVNSSTVTVNSIFPKNEELIWRPLPTNKSREAHCWEADLKISDAEFENSKSSTVEVGIGHSRGIISSSGSHYPHTLQLKFTITLKSIYKETTEEPVAELVMWNDVQKELDHKNANEISFDKLSITKEHEPRVSKWNLETLSSEIELFKELSEENCKFVNLTLARLLSAQDSVTSQGNLLMQKRTHSREVLELFNDLIKLDPSHARYYEDERSLVIMNQSTFDEKVIMNHSLQSSKLTPVSLRHAGMRLSRLSLTRIGCVERLLWVQMLDLSHNELRLITGLEALHLLVCLNLSHNRIGSFTALEPLKLLKSLKILNISSNEISSHPVDTSRYLCSSPLSHTDDAIHVIEEFKKKNVKVGDYWEAILLFKELNLTHLDITGNAVVDEAFRDLLPKVLPTLKWLDGIRI